MQLADSPDRDISPIDLPPGAAYAAGYLDMVRDVSRKYRETLADDRRGFVRSPLQPGGCGDEGGYTWQRRDAVHRFWTMSIAGHPFFQRKEANASGV